MTDQWQEQEREHALAELRVTRLKHQLVVAHVDLLGCLLRDGLIQPWGVRAALADISGSSNIDTNMTEVSK